MERYEPPFTLTYRMMDLVSDISEKIGRIDETVSLDSRPHLRRNNRIRSVHSSLKIEGNRLSEEEVRSLIDGHAVIGNIQDIKEVQNAYAAYEKISDTDPYDLNQLKRVHGILTRDLIEGSGEFRKGNEGVFSGDKCIFMAPPPHMVKELMEQLFEWMNKNKDLIHPLILSSVFHYEFVFIHPFSDGNGRMVRLWQTMLLYRWKEAFAYIPIESRIEKYQEEYYDAISACHANGSSDVFVEFMLQMIDESLDVMKDQIKDSETETSEYVKRMLRVMDYDVPYTSSSIMEKIGLRSKETFRRNYMDPAMKQGYVVMSEPEKPTSRNQRYIKKKE